MSQLLPLVRQLVHLGLQSTLLTGQLLEAARQVAIGNKGRGGLDTPNKRGGWALLAGGDGGRRREVIEKLVHFHAQAPGERERERERLNNCSPEKVAAG